MTDLNGKADVDLSNTTNQAKILMGGMAMPSNKYIDLTLGASGSIYTAPANGWYNIVRRVGANGDNERYLAGETSTGLRIVECSSSSWHELCLLIPVKKRDTVYIEYNATGEIKRCRFVYAQGSESEAS
jgi:hypothetical protein